MRDPGLALFLYVLLIIAALMLTPKWQELIAAITTPGTAAGTAATTATQTATNAASNPSLQHG